MADQTRELARRLRNVEREMLRRKQPSLGFSSLDGGALQVADDDDVLTLIIGKQFDGTNTAAVVTGPTPPEPTVPFCTGQPGTIRVYWDGTFADSLVAPMDFARVLAYAVPLASLGTPDPLDQAAMIGQFTSATGGELTAALDPGVEYGVYLVTWTQAGKYGPTSDVATVTVGDVVSGADLAEKNSVYRGTTPPWADGAPGHTEDVGDLWFDTTLIPGDINVVIAYSVTSNVVTMVTEGDNDILVGMEVSVTGVNGTVDGLHTITAETPDSFSFSLATANVALTDISQYDPPATAQGSAVRPLNRPYMWDGSAWIDLQDSGIEDVSTLINGAAVQISTNAEAITQTQEQLATLAVTATDAYNTAYAADGRIAISDYEPTVDDVAGKNDGSLWITRTRDRLNECLNPSFEVSTAQWAGTGTTSIVRTAVSPAGDGAYAGRVTNDGAPGLHYAYHTAMLATAGETITISGYIKAVSGSPGLMYAAINSYNASNGLTGSFASPVTVTPVTDDWLRVTVTAIMPDDTTYIYPFFGGYAGSEGAVWDLDAVLFERSGRLGRYFDGGSEGGSWNGAAELSTSSLDGGAIIRLFNLEDGSWSEKFWTADTISSVNASTIDRGEMDGGFIRDNSIPVDKTYMPDVVASETLFAGALVNVFNSSGVPMCRLAKASAVGYDATGFVLEAATAGQQPRVYTTGYNPLLSDLTPGTQFLSVTPGKCSSTPPQDIGTIVQRVGAAVSDTTIDFAALTSVALT